MKKLLVIFRFEFLSYARHKFFLGSTIALILALGIVLNYPRMFGGGEGGAPESNGPSYHLVVADESGAGNPGAGNPGAGNPGADASGAGGSALVSYLTGALPEAAVSVAPDARAAREAVENNGSKYAIVRKAEGQYEAIVKNMSMSDNTVYRIQAVLEQYERTRRLVALGVDAGEAAQALAMPVQLTPVEIGKNQMESFFATYVMIFLLYMGIMLYGQFVAMSAASEKGSRAMELLITSADPRSLMFGKVLGSGLAGLTQLGSVLIAGYIMFDLNRSYWAGNAILGAIFGMPAELLAYALAFYLLGFFLYAFLYGALGSMANRVEDVNMSVLPVTFLFVFAFMVVMFSMSAGSIDSALMVACSYFPLTSPMAMFVRISMGQVAGWQVALSMLLLAASTVGVGLLAAAIYRLGVLLYGKPPRPMEIVRMLRAAR